MSNVVELRPKKRDGRGLSLLNRKALRFVTAHLALHGEWPSHEEIRDALGLHSRLGVLRVLEPLFERNMLQRPATPIPTGERR